MGALASAHEKRGFTCLAVGPGQARAPRRARGAGHPLHLEGPRRLGRRRPEPRSLHPRGGQDPGVRRGAPVVFTPHPGEMARLLRRKVGAVNDDRPGAARDFAEELGGVCLLRAGARSSPATGACGSTPPGNAGLAKGGTGDA